MSSLQVAKVYSKALLEIGESNNSCDALEEELKGIKEILSKDTEIKDFLLSPRVNKKTKADIVEKSFTGTVTQNVLSFLLLVIANDRSNEIETIIDQYSILNDFRKGLIRVTLLSTVKLGDSELKQIKDWFVSTGKAKDTIIENKIKPELIGGFVLEYADNIVDSSMRSKLQKLKSHVINDMANLLGKDKIGAYYEN